MPGGQHGDQVDKTTVANCCQLLPTIADTDPRPGEEVTADYLYELDMAEPWYTDLYYQTYGTYKDNIES